MRHRIGILLLLALLAPGVLHAQDVTGAYRLTVIQDPGFDDCVWVGDLTLDQSSGNPGPFTGAASLAVQSGPCVPFTGTSTGSITGPTMTFGIGTGPLGTVVFNGAVTGSGDLAGAWTGLGLTGTWSASRVATNVPVMPPIVLGLLGLLVASLARPYLRGSNKSV